MSLKRRIVAAAFFSATAAVIIACKKDAVQDVSPVIPTKETKISAVTELFGDNIDLDALENYASQFKPAYITKDNSPVANPVTDKGATLGRVLFYDKKLSLNNKVACASCHKQELAFGDDAVQSTGVGGLTPRHAMRLVNARFSANSRFFWDKRAPTLELQATQPLRDAIEMGFSGLGGAPGIDALIAKLQALKYYKELFNFVYGDSTVTEGRIQNALAQFIRSIQSFDSRFDEGMSVTNNLGANFPNFTAEENLGKTIYFAGPGLVVGNFTGAGCRTCHSGPEFDLGAANNNGVTGIIGNPAGLDVSATNAPSLHDLTNPMNIPNGPFMHNGSLKSLMEVIDHYNDIQLDPANNKLDVRLLNNGHPRQLNLTAGDKKALVAFLNTLSGRDVYTNKKWSDPFVK